MTRKRLYALILALVLVVACLGGTAANIGISPMSTVTISGNLNKSTGVFYGTTMSPASESLTVYAVLEKQVGSGWHLEGTASGSSLGTTATAYGSAALSSGYYRLTVTGTCPHSGGTITYYYTV